MRRWLAARMVAATVTGMDRKECVAAGEKRRRNMVSKLVEKVKSLQEGNVLLLLLGLLGLGAWGLYRLYSPSFAFEPVPFWDNYRLFFHLFVGLCTLLMACAVGRNVSPERMLRWQWAVPVLLGVLLLCQLSCFRGGCFHCPQHSLVWVPAILIIILGMCQALAAMEVKESADEITAESRWLLRVKRFAMLGAMIFFALVYPFFTIHTASLSWLLFGVISLTVLTACRNRRLGGWLAVVCVGLLSWCLRINFMVERALSEGIIQEGFYNDEMHVAIKRGGWFGCQDVFHVPPGYISAYQAWNLDFIFAWLCNQGGVLAGALVMGLMGVLLTWAWSVVARQTQTRRRALAAGCAAVLTMRSLLHLAINFEVVALMTMPFPFVTYGWWLLLLDGLLVGVLLSLNRTQPEAEVDEPASWQRQPVLGVQWGIGLLLLLFAVRMLWLVVDYSR